MSASQLLGFAVYLCRVVISFSSSSSSDCGCRTCLRSGRTRTSGERPCATSS